MKVQISKAQIWTGRCVSTLVVLFLVMDAVIKFFMPPPVSAIFTQLGIPLRLGVTLGVILLISTAIYLIPRTAVLGAVLITAYLGGAIAIHLRVGDPLFSTALFPVAIGILIWLGLYLRDSRLRGILS